MIHLRIVASPGLAAECLALLSNSSAVVNVIHSPRVALEPPGDLVLTDVAREDASVVLEELRDLGVGREGSVTTSEIDSFSVTTIPAAANAGVAAAYRDWSEGSGALA